MLIRLNHNPIEINDEQIVVVAAFENLPETFDIDGNPVEEHQEEIIEIRAVAPQNLIEVDVVQNNLELSQEESLGDNIQ